MLRCTPMAKSTGPSLSRSTNANPAATCHVNGQLTLYVGSSSLVKERVISPKIHVKGTFFIGPMQVLFSAVRGRVKKIRKTEQRRGIGAAGWSSGGRTVAHRQWSRGVDRSSGHHHASEGMTGPLRALIASSDRGYPDSIHLGHALFAIAEFRAWRGDDCSWVHKVSPNQI